MTEYVAVLITAPSTEVAREIGRALLEKRLVACTNVIPGLNSLYWWQGNIEDDSEVMMVCKTRADVFESKLVPAVVELHPYDVPAIVALPILMASPDYLTWIDDEVRDEER
jgi:periplasmic divalent cation tolerance protein